MTAMKNVRQVFFVAITIALVVPLMMKMTVALRVSKSWTFFGNFVEFCLCIKKVLKCNCVFCAPRSALSYYLLKMQKFVNKSAKICCSNQIIKNTSLIVLG